MNIFQLVVYVQCVQQNIVLWKYRDSFHSFLYLDYQFQMKLPIFNPTENDIKT